MSLSAKRTMQATRVISAIESLIDIKIDYEQLRTREPDLSSTFLKGLREDVNDARLHLFETLCALVEESP